MCKFSIGTATFACVHGSTITVKGVKIPCGSWSCPECAKRKSIILGNRVKNGFENKRVRFATLTARKGLSLVGKLKSLKEAWNRLRLALRRHYGLETFFWVLEFGHERARPHLHVLLDCYVPQRALSKLAARAGFGSVVDIRQVKDGGGFGYVFKYLGKDCGSKLLASCLRLVRSRRYGTSRNIKPAPRNSDGTVCLDFVKHEVDTAFREASVQRVASVLGTAGDFVLKSETQSKWQGRTAFGEQDAGELLSWVHNRIISGRDLLMAGGYRGVRHGERFLFAVESPQGLVDDVPF